MAKLTEFGKFVSVQKSPDTGEVIGYRVRSSKNNVFKYFGVKEFGTAAKALEKAQKFSATALKTKVLTTDNYLEIRNKNKDLSTKNFAKYLNDKTDFVPERGSKFTRDGIKQLDNKLNYKSPFTKTKKEISESVKTKIFKDYKTQLAKGERNLSAIARNYFPNETRDAQSYLMRNILVEKGEDISQFKKVKGPNFDEVKDRGSRVRRERLGKAKKAAGLKAGKLSDDLVNKIKTLNDDVLKMSDTEILSNQKLINSMKINANVNNLNKGIITFDKYDDLSAKELVKKIKDRAKAGTFWQPEHISSVQGQAKNIYYPNNLQAAPGNMGAFMENFKKIAKEDPTNSILKKGGAVDKILFDYSMTVRDNKTKTRLGFKDVIEVDSANKTSNIIKANASSLISNNAMPMSSSAFNSLQSKLISSTNKLSKSETLKFCSLLSNGGLPGDCKQALKADPEKAAKILSEAPVTSAAMKDVKGNAQKMIRLFRGEPFTSRTAKSVKALSERFKVPLEEAGKRVLQGQFFSANPDMARSYTDKVVKMKYVDVTPKEFQDMKRYVGRINKTNDVGGKTRFPVSRRNDGNNIQIVPRRKLKQFEETGRMKSKLNIFGKVDTPEGILKYDSVIGGFVDPKYPTQVINDAQIKTWAAENPMPVKAGTEDALKPIKGNLLKTVGKSLAYVGAPLPTALIDSYFVGKQISEDKPAAEIAKDPLNWLGLATMSSLSNISGVTKPGKVNAALRLGMSPGLIRGVSRFAGIPGLAISTALTAYDQYEKYKNEEGLIYNFFNKDSKAI